MHAHLGERVDARRERDAALDAEPCNACQGRMRANLEGECPACAYERTRNADKHERHHDR